MAKKPKSAEYAEHPGVRMERKAIEALREKTGRSLDEWRALIRKSGPPGEAAAAAWLMLEMKVGTNYAKWLAAIACGSHVPGAYDADELVQTQYAGAKAALLPLYEALVRLAKELGPDVTLTPCATMVPIRRRHVIAQIKPATRTRIDFGLALKDLKPVGRLIDTGGFRKKDRITHKIEIASLKDIDAEVRRRLKQAYDLDG